MGCEKPSSLAEREQTPERYLQAGIIEDDLQLATVQVAGALAKELGLKKFDEEVASMLSKQDLPVIWQEMADKHEQALADKAAEQRSPEGDSVAYDPLGLVGRIVEKAYDIHTGQEVLEQKVASGGLRRKLRKRLVATSQSTTQPLAETLDAAEVPELEFPDILKPLAEHPIATQHLRAIDTAEKRYQAVSERLKALPTFLTEPRKALISSAGFAFDRTAATSVEVKRRKDTKEIVDDSQETDKSILEKIIVTRQEWMEFEQAENRIDSHVGLGRVLEIITDRFTCEPREQLATSRLAALDAIAQELDPTYSVQNEIEIPFTAANLSLVAAAIAIAFTRTFKHAPSSEDSTTMAWVEWYTDNLRYLVQDNPGRLANDPHENELTQIVEGTSILAISRSRDENETEKRKLHLEVELATPESVREHTHHSHTLIVVEDTDSVYERANSERSIHLFTSPARDFSGYAYPRIFAGEDKEATLFRSLGAYFRDNWDEMPQLEGGESSMRQEARERYVKKYLEPFLSHTWSYCMSMSPVDHIADAAHLGTAHELAIDSDVLEQISALDTKLWKIKDPDAAQAELRVMGIDSEELADMIHHRVVNTTRANSLVTRKFIQRYTRLLSNYVNGIFGSEVRPQDIATEAETSDITERAWAMLNRIRSQTRRI